MNYQKIYDNLIQDATKNPKADTYKEKHHIVPLCMGGNDSQNNLIFLTARQHYIAHWLLYKIHKTSSLLYAWHCMSRVGIGQKDRLMNSHHFKRCRKERKKLLSEQSKGSKNNFYGKSHTQESIQKMLESRNLAYSTNSELKEKTRQILSATCKKTFSDVPKTAEQRKRIGRKNMVMLANIHTKEIVRVQKNNEYDPKVWVNMRCVFPENKNVGCKHCDIRTTASNIKRWHNENCKHKLN